MAIAAAQTRRIKADTIANPSIGSGDGWVTPTAGNLIVVTFNGDNAGSLTGYTAGPSIVDNNAAYLWYKVAAGTETAVTITAVAGNGVLTACEYSGVTGTPFDVQNSSTLTTSGTTTTATSVTTTAAGDLIVVGALIHNYTVALTGPTWTNSFVNQLSAGNGASGQSCWTFYAELIAGAAGAYSTGCTWTNAAGDRQQVIAAFKAAAAAPATVWPRRGRSHPSYRR
jgi:hypothetical protein